MIVFGSRCCFMGLFYLSLCRQESYLIPPASEHRYTWETITKNAEGTVAEMARRATGIHICHNSTICGFWDLSKKTRAAKS